MMNAMYFYANRHDMELTPNNCRIASALSSYGSIELSGSNAVVGFKVTEGWQFRSMPLQSTRLDSPQETPPRRKITKTGVGNSARLLFRKSSNFALSQFYQDYIVL